MTIRSQIPLSASPSPEAGDIRTYILTMMVELAEMADKIGDATLAENLRHAARPTESRSFMSLR